MNKRRRFKAKRQRARRWKRDCIVLPSGLNADDWRKEMSTWQIRSVLVRTLRNRNGGYDHYMKRTLPHRPLYFC